MSSPLRPLVAVLSLLAMLAIGSGCSSDSSARAQTDYGTLREVADGLLSATKTSPSSGGLDKPNATCEPGIFRSGEEATISWALRGDGTVPDSQVLSAASAELRAANDRYFSGRGRVVDNASAPGRDVMLIVDESGDKYSVMVAAQQSGVFTLDASGPCR